MDEEKTALTDNELFLALKRDMDDTLALVRKVRKTNGPLATVDVARQLSEKIEGLRSELYLLQEAIDEMSEQVLNKALYG